MTFDWPYYTWNSETGYLVCEDGTTETYWPKFNSSSDAERWLEDNDIRGSVTN